MVTRDTPNFSVNACSVGIGVSLAMSGDIRLAAPSADREREPPDVFSRIARLVAYVPPRCQPRPYLHAAEAIGVDPRHCIVLEDSEPGVRGALAAGMIPIMVPDMLAPSEDLLARGPLVLASLADVRLHLAALPR